MWKPRDLERLVSVLRAHLAVWERLLGEAEDADPSQPESPFYVIWQYVAHGKAFIRQAEAVPFAVCRRLGERYPDTRDPREVLRREQLRILSAAGLGEAQVLSHALALCRHFLRRYEARYGCLSPAFYPRHVAGLWLHPGADADAWAELYRSFRALLQLAPRFWQHSA